MDGEESLLPSTRRPAGGMRKGDQRRQAILDAVEQLLSERSIAELSVEDIALSAGISRSGFYFYFESKYAALAESLTEVFEEMIQAAEAFFVGTDEPPAEYVPRALSQVAEVWARHEALLVGMFEASSTDAGARALWDGWLDRFIPAIAERIDLERAEGRATDHVPSTSLARTLLLMNERVLYDDRKRRGSPEETAAAVDALTAVWLAAVWGERVPV
jgi:TetR/AcrR family transcriptional regulator, ethionamide resistance regulator